MIYFYFSHYTQNQSVMREYANKPESQSRTLDSNLRASRQAPIADILQAYNNGTLGRQLVQRESVEDEELLQAKTSGQVPVSAIFQRHKESIQRYVPEEDEELIQGKFDTAQRGEIDEDEILQGKFESVSTTEQEPVQREEKPNNTGLPDNLKAGIENFSGYSMDDVKVHYNSDKPAQLNALAYAQGTDIHISAGQEKHLPHEAWHVVQQIQGRVQPTMQLQGINVNDNAYLEKEADLIGGEINQYISNNYVSSYIQNKKSDGIVQRTINVEDLDSVPDIPIKKQIVLYNQLPATTAIAEKINALSKIEHAIYTWLINNKAPDINAVPGAAKIRELMDITKNERTQIVLSSLKNDESNPPIAGFDQLGKVEQTEVTAMWKNLITGRGKIKISNINSKTKEEHSNFRLKVLVEFTRLLEGKFGRSMVKEIDESAHEVIIEPIHIDNKESQSFAASPVDHDAGKLVKLRKEPNVLELAYYPEFDITRRSEEHRLAFFNRLKPTMPNQLGVKLKDGDVVAYYQFGKGSSVRVTMPSDLPDSSQYNESRLVDTTGNELATPVFITLGHELGHAIHMQRGTLTKETEITNFLTKKEDQIAYTDDKEEYINIEGNENSLRAEHGLGTRKGHYNIPYLQKEQMTRQMGIWFKWYDNLGALQKMPVFKEIDKTLGAINNRIFTEWANPVTLPKLKIDFANLPEEIKTIQLKYLTTYFDEQINNEYSHIMFALYSLRGKSTASYLDINIAQLLFAIDMELKYEKHQAREAIGKHRLPEYLQGISQQRIEYSTVKFGRYLDPIYDALQNDSTKIGKLRNIMTQYNNVNWLFR